MRHLNRFIRVGGIVLLAACAAARAGEGPPVTQGSLRVVDPEGRVAECPLRHTEVRAEITGPVVRVLVTQTFQNPYDRKIEAVYVFPLPDKAAVDDMQIAVAGVTIKGVIKKKEEARAVYQAARRAGRVAGLFDQERPNIFTQSVANILPGSDVVVTIRYFETLPYESGIYTFAFPMVVGPRFIPGDTPPAPASEDPGTGREPGTTEVPDASRLTPPVLEPGLRSGHDIALEVGIDGGGPLRDLASPSHLIEVGGPGRSHAIVRIRPEDSIPNKDFVLRYRIDGEEPSLVVLPHREEGDGRFLLLLQPEASPPHERITSKEMIFVVDCSGSMSGSPIEKVQEAMRYALAHLDPLDTFQIIRFSEKAEAFRREPVLATPANVDDALRYVERLSGNGGTIMIEGVRKALAYKEDPQRLRIVSFMTDGYIGNEETILKYLSDHLGGARLFSFGVGSSPNRYLLDRMADFGRGAVEYMLLGESSEAPVQRFYDRIRSPYLTDISIDWGDLRVTDLHPGVVPDLFLGQPIVLYGRYARPGAGEVTLRGRLGGRPYERRFRIDLPERHEEGEAIATLWARARIEDLSSEQIRDPNPARIDEITELALANRLVSAYTSFVAVAEWTGTGAEESETVAVPVPLPEGVSYEGVIGGQGSTEVGETIQVVAAGDVVNTESTSTSTTFSSEFIDGLSILGRDYQDVLTLVPGVSGSGEGGFLVIHGARDTDVIKGKGPRGFGAPTGVACRIEAPRRSYRVGESIEIAVTIENRSGATIELPRALAIADGTARFSVTDETGSTLPDPSDHTAAVATLRLSPGVRTTLRIILNGPGGYSLDRPGKYRVVFHGGDLGACESNTLVLTIKA